eukprot:TRINITY_DN1169_c0_g1_i5.p1 TRINITY_DN1169_c0_g1~~TRINITY_DN1169_c0_g1_i5.p1  ORF type:complete len:561 (-),score=105.69 TRINITY_DN1169_c0_g1_i5:88-1770(-)
MPTTTIVNFCGVDEEASCNGVDLTCFKDPLPLCDAVFDCYNTYDVMILAINTHRFAFREATGGSGWEELVPAQLAGSMRGYICISINWTSHAATRVTFVREFFHTVEQSIGFGPQHAWHAEQRHLVPEWSGSHEYEYYAHRYETTVAEAGFHNLSWLPRYPLPYSSLTYHRNRRVCDEVPLPKRVLAQQKVRAAADVGATKARALLNEALAANPFSAEALQRYIELALESDIIDDVSTLLAYQTRFDDIRPEDYRAMMWRAHILCKQRNEEASLAAWDEIRQCLRAAHTRLLQCYNNSEDDINALAADAVTPLAQYAWRPRRKQLWEATQSVFEVMIEMAPHAAWVHLDFAWFLNERQQFVRARAEVDEALRLSPMMYQCYALKARLVLLQDRDEALALQCTTFALKADKQNSMAGLWVEYAALRNDNPAHQQTLFERALGYDARHPSVYLRRGFMWRAQKLHDKARVDFRHAADLGHADAAGYLEDFYDEKYTPERLEGMWRCVLCFVVFPLLAIISFRPGSLPERTTFFLLCLVLCENSDEMAGRTDVRSGKCGLSMT